MNTEAELSAYGDDMNALLDRILDEFGLVVSGWSGAWDAALRSAFERCRSRRYATYWRAIGDPGPRAADLIGRRDAQVVRTASADALFTALEEKVRALDDLREAHPVTTAVAATVLRPHAEPQRRERPFDGFQVAESCQQRGDGQRGRIAAFQADGEPDPVRPAGHG